MAVPLRCTCGRDLSVELSQAGGEVACECGETIAVPSLSKLRELSGKGAYEAGIIDTINRMIGSGELPWGDRCAVSGEPTSDAIDLYVEAERVFQGGSNTALIALLAVVCSPLLALILAQKPRQDVGRTTIVHTPLRVAARNQRRVLRWSSQRAIKRWLRSVPVYAELLNDYPRAQVVFELPGEIKQFDEQALEKTKDLRDPDFDL